MNIHIETLLAKIGEELTLAKAAMKEEELREKLYSIKTLCEVALAKGSRSAEREPGRLLTTHPVPQAGFQAVPGQGKKLEDDEANGDSIFDF
ncbi:YwdI family protein [Bacillus sp. FJAT-27245]|uniref:YwdI family protein n=1 Tax=Bacillus sp. FJAT-27245 TaxID=1684144 RepID=UPI0006A78A67|nr:YwdI family protein [Bacillus sp. FJAT-27245]